MEWPELEKLSLAVWMCGNNSRNQLIQYRENLVIRNEIYTKLGEILESIYQEFHIDLRGNLELHMSLAQHMMPMDIRLKYGLKLANPLLENIRSMYPLAWQIAGFMAAELEHIYEASVSDDEIGYLAVIFELALQKKEHSPEKKNVLLVCVSGRGTAQLLRHQIESRFYDHIDRLYVKGTLELEDRDFEEIDLVVTTVPLNRGIQIPVIEINELLTLNNQAEMRLALQSDKPFLWESYYKEDLFFSDLCREHKEEVLEQMCEMISERYPMPEDFFQSVMNRENTASTDIGIRSALPHPDRLIPESTMIAVGVLRKPVFWGKKEVSLVILALIGKGEDPDIQKFYEGTIRLLSDAAAISELEARPDHQTLIRLLNSGSFPRL
ncbi:MAG: PRD domain-containing protein [Ruminococcus sp.]|nr:PRD domain-containing protein [Ruminococcus sp.]